MAALYDIMERLHNLLDMADDEDVEQDVFNDTLEALEGEYDDKIDQYCRAVKNTEAESEALKEEIKRLTAKKKHVDKIAERLRRSIYSSMTSIGRKKAGRILSASIRANGGILPLQLAENLKLEELPEAYRKVEYKADTDAIRKALEAGEALAFARFGERGENLQIK